MMRVRAHLRAARIAVHGALHEQRVAFVVSDIYIQTRIERLN